MYKSEELDKEIQKIRTPANSSDLESKDKHILNRINTLSYDYHTRKFWDYSVVGFLVFCLSMAIQSAWEINQRPVGWVIASLMGMMIVITVDYFLERPSSAHNVKKLIELLIDTPYEVRVSYVGYLKERNSLKITIEENLVDPAGVIKEKSRHITAYLDTSAHWEKQLDFIKSLVNKAETSFKK